MARKRRLPDRPARTRAWLDALSPAMRWTGTGSLMTAHFHLARRGMVALSLEVGEAELDGFADAVAEFLHNRARPLADPT